MKRIERQKYKSIKLIFLKNSTSKMTGTGTWFGWKDEKLMEKQFIEHVKTNKTQIIHKSKFKGGNSDKIEIKQKIQKISKKWVRDVKERVKLCGVAGRTGSKTQNWVNGESRKIENEKVEK